MTFNRRPEGIQPAVTQSRDHALQTKCIGLTREKAAHWLRELSSSVVPNCEVSNGMEQLLGSLEDACWLARWKREDVLFEFCPTIIAQVLDELVEMSRSCQLTRPSSVYEEIIQDLSSTSLD